MLEYIVGTAADFLGAAASWLNFPYLPWNGFAENWNKIVRIIAPWNRIFPITDILTIIGFALAVAGALMIFYTVVLIKSFIPGLGGK